MQQERMLPPNQQVQKKGLPDLGWYLLPYCPALCRATLFRRKKTQSRASIPQKARSMCPGLEQI